MSGLTRPLHNEDVIWGLPWVLLLKLEDGPESSEPAFDAHQALNRRFQELVITNRRHLNGSATCANLLNVTVWRLKRAVQAATGESAGWFATQRFLAEAKRPLHSSLSVKEVGSPPMSKVKGLPDNSHGFTAGSGGTFADPGNWRGAGPNAFPSGKTFFTSLPASPGLKTSMKTFLLIGLDPQTLAGATAKTLAATIADMQRQFAARGNRLDLCVVKPGGSAEAPVTAQLARATYDCVLIGGGIREPDDHLELLERIVNTIHHQAPGAAIGFVLEPDGCLKAADRVLSPAYERAGLLAASALVG